MGEPTCHKPVLRLVAVITRHESALVWASQQLVGRWGPVALQSAAFAFEETRYYESTMGPHLSKTFLTFEPLADATELVTWKLWCNELEKEYAALGRHDESRPLNLDPGYVTPAKLVLASTKDHAHRIYLGRGIYAEITLAYRDGGWRHHEFTFPDYRRDDYQRFFTDCRKVLQAAKDGLL
ncbi:MAG TPA: DUF4416 family protein [Pirellulales bacterium]|jgi:hypothetical protein|nr:DUF4416 family protein [Pirellulales bacterium]